MLLTMTMLLYVSDLSNPKYDDTSLDNSTKLKFGTVGNSFQRSPRLGSCCIFANTTLLDFDAQMIKSAWKHMMDVSKGAPTGCPTLRYHPGDHGVQTLLLKWPSWPWHATGPQVSRYMQYIAVYLCAPNVISMIFRWRTFNCTNCARTSHQPSRRSSSRNGLNIFGRSRVPEKSWNINFGEDLHKNSK